MKIKVNTEVIAKLDPCKDRFDNWKEQYPSFNGDITKFLRLPNITHSDKLWVALRLIPADIRVVFALDMSFSAYAAAADAAYAAYAAYAYAAAAADAAYVYAAAAAYAAADAAADAAYAYAADAADAAADAAYAYAAADAAADAAYAYAAADAAAKRKEEESQIEVLIYLISGE